VNPTEFISFAANLAIRKGLNAASYRSATSRAYYGAYHFARQILVSIGHEPGGLGSTHVKTHRYLQACDYADARMAGSLLSSLHSERIRADYKLDLSQPDEYDKACESYQSALEVQRLLSKCDEVSIRIQMTKDISAYRKQTND
jgi:uncharacterized protein (UPF0332 family)